MILMWLSIDLYQKQAKMHTITQLPVIGSNVVLNRDRKTEFIKTIASKFILDNFVTDNVTLEKICLGKKI